MLLASLFIGLSQAATVMPTPQGCPRCPRCPYLMLRWVFTFCMFVFMIMGCFCVGFTVADFYNKCSALTDSSSQIETRSIDDVSANVTLVERDLLGPLSSAALSTVMAYPCSDKKCLKKYYDEKKECHPYDIECYKDSSSWDDYKDRCTNSVQKKGPYDPYNPYGPYDKCYDKCYYERQGCFKYRKCSKDNKEYDDKECYKKRRDEPEPPKYRDRFCKPKCKPENKDCYECKRHREEPDKYECDPRKDKHEYCLPHYDDHDDHYHHHHDYHPFEPKSYITAHFYNDYGKDYIEKVWPDGDEHWFSKSSTCPSLSRNSSATS